MGHGLTGRAAEECRMEPRFHFSSANSVTILQVRIFRIIAKPCLVPDPGAERLNARTRHNAVLATCGSPWLILTLDWTRKKLDLILKSASLFYQIICVCVMCHIMHLRYCTQDYDYRTQISKVPSMHQRCALSDSVDSVSSVSSCRDTEIVNTCSNHT